jgi:hypothetical protein
MKMRYFGLLGVILGIAMMPLRAQNCFSPVESCPTECTDSVIDLAGTVRVSDLGVSEFSGAWEIQDSLIVDIDTLVLNGARLGMLTGSVILVETGSYLRILNGSILTNYQGLWEGIRLEKGSRIQVNESSVCGARVAIAATLDYAGTPSPVRVRNSLLRYNHIGIVLGEYTAGQYPLYVAGTHFDGGPIPSDSILGSSALSFTGVLLRNLVGAEVGDLSTAADSNYFTYHQRGITAINSSLGVYNSVFEQIYNLGLFGNGEAVYSALGNPPGGPYRLQVGTSKLRPTKMKDCRFGVVSSGISNVIVSDNFMWATTDSFEVGIRVTRTDDSVILGENVIADFQDTGIWLSDLPGPGGGLTAVSVNNSRIVGSGAKTRGVLVSDLEGGVNVRVNEISEVHQGVVLQAIPTGEQVRVDVNKIAHAYAGLDTEPSVGILVQDVSEPWVFRNQVLGNCPYPAGGGPCTTLTANNGRIRAVQLEQTLNAAVFSNTLRDAGAGLYVYLDNPGGNVVCNNFRDTYSGLVWDSVQREEFGVLIADTFRVYGLSPDRAYSENRWTSTVSGVDRIRSFAINTSQMDSLFWFHRNAPTYDFPVGTNITIGSALPIHPELGVSPSIDICSLLANIGIGERLPGDSLGFEQMSSSREAELSAWSATYGSAELDHSLYRYLRAAFYAGSSNEAIQAALLRTNIPAFEVLRQHWHAAELEEAQAVWEAISPHNTEEALLHTVWGIRLQTEREGEGSSWSSEDREVLLTIAHTNLADAGSAAILAQSLLGLSLVQDRWEVADAEALRTAEPQKLPTLFPNPANHSVTLQGAEDLTHVLVLDLMGREVWQARHDGSALLSLSTASWPEGAYLVRLQDGQGQYRTEKLLIQR